MQIKNVKDYYEPLSELFPDVPKNDIKRVLNYGLKSVYLHNLYGGDTIIKDSMFWCYIGKLTRDSIVHFNYYIKKLSIRLRVLYNRKKIEWDGYYYFALTDKQYEEYLSQKNSKGRKRKKFKYGNQVLYKIFDECSIRESGRRYIFRIPYISDLGFKFYKANLESDKAELIVTREPLKFKDILVSTNNYKFL